VISLNHHILLFIGCLGILAEGFEADQFTSIVCLILDLAVHSFISCFSVSVAFIAC
jgi:hypothetical protein